MQVFVFVSQSCYLILILLEQKHMYIYIYINITHNTHRDVCFSSFYIYDRFLLPVWTPANQVLTILVRNCVSLWAVRTDGHPGSRRPHAVRRSLSTQRKKTKTRTKHVTTLCYICTISQVSWLFFPDFLFFYFLVQNLSFLKNRFTLPIH